MGAPPPGCGQTDRWTDTCQNVLPSRRTTYAGGNKSRDTIY